MKTQALIILAEIVRLTMAPKPSLTVDMWADTHRRLTSEAAAEPGRWSTDRAPYLRGPMRAMTRADVDEISLGFASQTGKTECLVNFAGWVCRQDPSPAMWFWPNEDLAGEFTQDRLLPAIEASPTWRDLLGDAPRDRKTAHLKFRRAGMDLWLKGAGSDAQGKSKPAKYRIADEIDSEQFDPAMLDHARQRGAAWPGGKFIKASIPSFEGAGIDGELNRSTCHWFHVPCPHCGEFQRLGFANLKWTGGARRANAVQAERTAVYACDRCGAAIYDHDKPGMLARGVWVAGAGRVEKDHEGTQREGSKQSKAEEAEEVDSNQSPPLSSSALSASSEFPPGFVCGLTLLPGYTIVGEPEEKGRHWGYRLSALYSPWVSFGSIAKGWCDHDGEPPREWFNGVLGEAWAPRGDRVDADQVIRQCLVVDDRSQESERISRAGGAYKLLEVHPRALVLVGGIDLQRDRAYVTVRAFGERVRESWLVWFGVLPCPHGDESAAAAALERVIERRWGMDTKAAVKASRWAIDSGDGVRTAEVYRFARRFPGRVYACKGRPGDMASPTSKTRIDKYPDGKPIPGGLTLLTVNTWKFKGQILGKLKQPMPEAVLGRSVAAELEAEGTISAPAQAGRCWWPDPKVDAEGEPVNEALVGYFEQLTAEHLIIDNPRAVEKGARPVFAWKLRPGRKGNHFLDAEVYAQAVAEADFATLTREYVERMRGGTGDGGQGTREEQKSERRRERGVNERVREMRAEFRERRGAE